MIVGPFWRYYGGKWRAAPRYPAPECDTIVAPFAGAAGYCCRYPSRDVVLVDASPQIVTIWEWLISATPDDVLAVGDVPEGGTVDDIDAPRGAQLLAGFWCNNGAAAPCKTPSRWAREQHSGGQWSGWSAHVRDRIAADVPRIKHWRIIHGDYTAAPDVFATWMIDPPYQSPAGGYYPYQVGDRSLLAFDALGRWCDIRRGQVIACDQEGSTWRPWTHRIAVTGMKSSRSAEVYWHRSIHPTLFPIATRGDTPAGTE